MVTEPRSNIGCQQKYISRLFLSSAEIIVQMRDFMIWCEIYYSLGGPELFVDVEKLSSSVFCHKNENVNVTIMATKC